MDKRQLRQQIRARRRALNNREKQLAAQRLARRMATEPRLQRARRVGLYLPNDGEIDPRPGLLNGNRQRQLYLPILDPINPGRLGFARWQKNQPLHSNRFGIPEPQLPASRLAALWSLDVLIMPLVAFDSRGGRLGMGGGFYDRTLAGWRRWPRRPVLVGVGYRFQQVESLPLDPWDIPLDLLLSD